MRKVESAPPPRPLQLRPILVNSFVLPWLHRREVLHRCGFPLLLIIGITLLWNSVSEAALRDDTFMWMAWGVYAIANCWLALAVHRMVLLDEPGKTLQLEGASLQRFAQFVAAAAFVWVVYQIAFYAGAGVVSFALNVPYVPGAGAENATGAKQWIGGIASLVAFVVMGRVSLLLPMVAVNKPFDILEAWLKSDGNAWRLAVLVGVMPWLLLKFTELLYRDGFSKLEQVLIVSLGAWMLVVEVVALSFAYRELTTQPTAPAPPPTDPPA